MKNELKEAGYEAPKMEATSFRTESGYATSGTTQAFNDIEISFQS